MCCEVQLCMHTLLMTFEAITYQIPCIFHQQLQYLNLHAWVQMLTKLIIVLNKSQSMQWNACGSKVACIVIINCRSVSLRSFMNTVWESPRFLWCRIPSSNYLHAQNSHWWIFTRFPLPEGNIVFIHSFAEWSHAATRIFPVSIQSLRFTVLYYASTMSYTLYAEFWQTQKNIQYIFEFGIV